MIQFLIDLWNTAHGWYLWPLIWAVIRIVAIILPLLGLVAYLTLWERKAIAWSQIRPGPNRVGPLGLLTPIADAVKLIFKEIIRPTAANKSLFFIAPVMTIMPALAAWAVVPFDPGVVLADVNAGLLFIMAITSLEVYGVIVAGWASNSKYAFLGALRASAQMVSYEIAMGFCLVVVLMVSGTMNMGEIVMGQGKGMMADHGLNFLSWNWLPLLPIFFVYFISGLAETNRAPFDVVEGESEIVAGHMVEYSGMAFAMFFLAEYANMILVSTLCVIMFLGGWLPPFGFLSWNWLSLLPVFLIYFISGIAETNRHPFDVVEGESEIVAGHMIEYSGMSFAMFFLAEYANMILVSILCVTLFLGGWLSPVDHWLFNWVPGWIWLGAKTFVVVTMFLWVRATFPRYRYDQIMRLGWKIFIPVTLVWLVVVGLWMQTPFSIWK